MIRVANHRPRPAATGPAAGFSLLELLTVVAIIGIATAVAVPAISSWAPRYQHRAAARDLLASLQQAKMNAVRDFATWEVRFATASNSYALFDPDGNVTDTVALEGYGHGIRLIGAAETTCGTATKNWNGDPIAQTAVEDGEFMSFTPRGFSTPRSVYLESNSEDVCFALTTSTSGALTLRRYGGDVPFSASAWQ